MPRPHLTVPSIETLWRRFHDGGYDDLITQADQLLATQPDNPLCTI